MSNNHYDRNLEQRPDAELDRHIEALRDEAVPDGPSPETLAATLAMLGAPRLGEVDSGGARIGGTGDRDAGGGRPIPKTRSSSMTFAQRLYLAVSLAAAACVLWFIFVLLGPFGPTVAYGQVIEKLTGAKALAYTMSVVQPDGKSSAPMRTVIADGGRMRIGLREGIVVIRDGARLLTLDAKAKTATRLDIPDAPVAGAPTPIDLIDGLKRIAGATPEKLGDKEIDGAAVTGFRAPWADGGKLTISADKLTVWADKKTAAPVRIEITMQMGGKPTTAVLDHIEVIEAVDPADFSTEVPAGYALVTPKMDLTKVQPPNVAEAVAAVLKPYAAANDGAFPANLTDWSAMMKRDAAGKSTVDPQLIGTMSGQLFSIPGGYGYAGAGAKLGDKDKIVFWFQPSGARTYHALFGDLHVEDVAADRIPTTRPASTKP